MNYQFNTGNRYVNYGSAICGETNYADHDCGFPAPYDWSLSQIYDVSFGFQLANATPEIYVFPPPGDPANAKEWTMASLFGYYHGAYGAIFYEGPMDTYPLAPSTNTSQQAWQELTEEIELYPQIAYTDSMSYSLEIINGY